jgi:hypothetical protein
MELWCSREGYGCGDEERGSRFSALYTPDHPVSISIAPNLPRDLALDRASPLLFQSLNGFDDPVWDVRGLVAGVYNSWEGAVSDDA